MLHILFINVQKIDCACKKLLGWLVAEKEVFILL